MPEGGEIRRDRFIGLIAGLVAATGWLVPLLAILWAGWKFLVRPRLQRGEG